MTSFLDGPAAGQRLMLKRAPRFIRVVTHGGKFDALDQLGDVPLPSEAIHVYEITGKPGGVHLNTRGKPGGGFFTIAKYRQRIGGKAHSGTDSRSNRKGRSKWVWQFPPSN